MNLIHLKMSLRQNVANSKGSENFPYALYFNNITASTDKSLLAANIWT